MSEEFGAGVQILLKRLESNPDEFKEEYGKWAGIRDAVFAFKERGDMSAWLRGLTPQEIDALYEKLNVIYRNTIDEWVMKQVLVEPEQENLKYKATERFAHSWNDPRMLKNSITSYNNPNSISLQSNPNMLAKIKKGLGL